MELHPLSVHAEGRAERTLLYLPPGKAEILFLSIMRPRRILYMLQPMPRLSCGLHERATQALKELAIHSAYVVYIANHSIPNIIKLELLAHSHILQQLVSNLLDVRFRHIFHSLVLEQPQEGRVVVHSCNFLQVKHILKSLFVVFAGLLK